MSLVTHTFNPKTWEAEADRSLWSTQRILPGIQSKFQTSLGYSDW